MTKQTFQPIFADYLPFPLSGTHSTLPNVVMLLTMNE